MADHSTPPIGWLRALPRKAAHGAIRFYQLTISSLIGRQCRHLPTCSSYTDAAIGRYGLWAGGWVGLARICRCHPWGTDGFDPVPDALGADARWFAPWRYATWSPRAWRGRKRDASGEA